MSLNAPCFVFQMRDAAPNASGACEELVSFCLSGAGMQCEDLRSARRVGKPLPFRCRNANLFFLVFIGVAEDWIQDGKPFSLGPGSDAEDTMSVLLQRMQNNAKQDSSIGCGLNSLL